MGWSWRNKKTTCAGSVLFRGGVPPRAEEFAHLERRGFGIVRAEPSRAAHWGLRVSHPKWGEADVVCLRNCPRPPRQLIDFDPMLTRPEREAAYLGESTVSVMVAGQRADVLRDRKTLLRFMRAVMGDDGVVAVDHTAQRFWPPEALDDEVCHEADLDIESLYTLHAVTGDEAGDGEADGEGNGAVTWLHSHGLAEIGLFDFDVLRPSEDLMGRGRDALRAVAFAILEGAVSRNTPRFRLMMPGGDVRFVDVRDFLKRGGRAANDLRPGADADHNRDRAVLCAVGGGWLGRLFGRVTPSRVLSRGVPEEMTVPFSTAASNLMAERARGTYLQFRQLAGEFAEFDFPVIVKLGYRMDGGRAGRAGAPVVRGEPLARRPDRRDAGERAASGAEAEEGAARLAHAGAADGLGDPDAAGDDHAAVHGAGAADSGESGAVPAVDAGGAAGVGGGMRRAKGNGQKAKGLE